MTTNWAFPNIVSQAAEVENHVPWGTNYHSIKTTDLDYLSTTDVLLHIANRQTNNLKMKTYYLYLTGFNFNQIPAEISGVEVELDMRRGGRITDDTIQLRYEDQFIGENLADYKLDNTKLLGSSTDKWGVDNLTPEMISNSSFGLGLRFQSHPEWPHREYPMINYVRMRIW